jgi:GNAT superfamily N-acetyltransferase
MTGDATPAEETVRVRRAEASDARSIAEITVAAWQVAYRAILPDDLLQLMRVEPRETAWQELLGGEGGAPAVWVAEVGDTVEGFVSCGPLRDEDLALHCCEVYALYVRPESWRRGIGRALLETALRHGREIGATTQVLWVLEDNRRARDFYEALGWVPEGARREFEPGLAVTEIRYRLAGA